MPRYFFHVCDGEDFEDLQGTILPDIDAARRESVRFAGALLKDQPETFWDAGEWRMRVTDENDMTLFELSFCSMSGPSNVTSDRLGPSVTD